VGAEPVDHEEKLLCCGKACENEEIPPQMTRDVLASIKKLNVDCMGLICPTCFDEYDIGQLKLARKFNVRFDIPIIYYFQLLGLSQGFSAQEMGLGRHKIKAQELLAKVDDKVKE